jgi:hypothetical protein
MAFGPAFGYRPFSFHRGHSVRCVSLTLAGRSLDVDVLQFYGVRRCSLSLFRRRYSATQLNLTSVAPRADLVLIVTIAVLESAYQLTPFRVF